MKMTAQEVAALNTLIAVGEAIKGFGSIPSGRLYTHLMNHMDLETYNKVIGLLVKMGAVTNENHLLTWVGK
jgi:hypothetical protein